jgi:hypothetical protein
MASKGSPNNPGLIKQQIVGGGRYISKEALTEYFKKKWPSAIIGIKVCSLSPK